LWHPDRLVFTIAALDADGSIRLANLPTVSLVDHAVGTELTLHVRVLQATAEAASNLAGTHVGRSESLERLVEQVAG
jgi:hypothetical protein